MASVAKRGLTTDWMDGLLQMQHVPSPALPTKTRSPCQAAHTQRSLPATSIPPTPPPARTLKPTHPPPRAPTGAPVDSLTSAMASLSCSPRLASSAPTFSARSYSRSRSLRRQWWAGRREAGEWAYN